MPKQYSVFLAVEDGKSACGAGWGSCGGPLWRRREKATTRADVDFSRLSIYAGEM